MERLSSESHNPNQLSSDILNAGFGYSSNEPLLSKENKDFVEKTWEPSGKREPKQEKQKKTRRGRRALATIVAATTLFTGAAGISEAVASPHKNSATEVAGPCGNVVDQANRIANHLVIGGQGWDKLTESLPSYCGYTARATGRYTYAGQYWCTKLIYDSYNLVGLKVPKYEGVISMRQWWQHASGFKYVNYEQNKQNIYNVHPGYAMFMEDPGPGQKQHVAVINTIWVDGTGNGQINTIEANANRRWKSYSVRHWQVQGTVHAVKGFGGA